MELFYGELRKFKFGSFTKIGNKIIIDKTVLTYIPYNEEFLLIAQATFKSSSQSQDLSIIFKLSFATDIILATWSPIIGVTLGSNLYLDTSSALLINSAITSPLSFTWDCPLVSCPSSAVLDLAYSTVYNYLETYTFTLYISNSDFALPGPEP